MNVESFIDTNVFVYQLEGLDARKAGIADRLIEHGIESQTACISFQVIQECLNTALRKAEVALTEDQMRQYLGHVLAPLYRVQPDIRLYEKSLEIRSRYRFSFYDSLIIAAAIEAGCETLYTKDLTHGQHALSEGDSHLRARATTWERVERSGCPLRFEPDHAVLNCRDMAWDQRGGSRKIPVVGTREGDHKGRPYEPGEVNADPEKQTVPILPHVNYPLRGRSTAAAHGREPDPLV